MFKRSKLKEWIFPLIILLITSFIAFKNYTPNTYLTGWDNLHPEFNFKLNIGRSLNAVWQEYQGLGLLGGMAHSADLPRQLILAVLSFFMPIHLIRYLWTFLMLFIGPLGIYFLLKEKSKIAAFAASIFYLCNLATVQYFFVPFETFTAFFGFLPWLIYFAYSYLTGKKSLLSYVLISILAVPAFYVQTLFIVYIILLTCLIVFNFKRSIWLFLTTFLVNAFWLLPVIYFTIINGNTLANSKINLIATPETQYMNLARDDFKSIVTFKGYWFDYYDWNQETQKFDYLYKNWEEFSSQKYVEYIGIGLFITSIIGLVTNRQASWILMLIISFIMIIGVKIPIPILSEAFRNSFTKWSVALSFITSIGIGLFLSRFRKIFLYLFSIIIIALSVYQVLPVFKGNLISESMRVSIPEEYFLSFDFLNTRTNGGRVVILPSYNFWGWQFHSWGYRGSGFYWYGIKNPILDRAFDVWSKQNENFYEELNFGLSSNDSKLLKKIFEKYQVSYIYLDKNVITPGNNNIILPDLSKFKLIASFGNIDIYETGYFGEQITIPKDLFSDEVLKISQKVNTDESFTINPQIVEQFKEDQGYRSIPNCDLFEKGTVSRDRTENGNLYSASDGGTACDYFYYPTIDNTKPFVMHIKGKNIEGRSLKFYAFNAKAQRVVAEELLPVGDFDSYYLIKPIYFNALDKTLANGYTLSVETRSFGKVASKNIISAIEIYPVELSEPKQQGYTLRYDLEVKSIKKYSTAIYRVKTTGSGIIELGQGYESGWVSYPKLEHLKINGWANGFKVKSDGVYYIIFWPQFLEWFGFVVLCIVVVSLVFGSVGNRKENY